MGSRKTGQEGAFADQSAEGQSNYSEGDRNPDQGSEDLGGDDGDEGHDKAGSSSRQSPRPDEK